MDWMPDTPDRSQVAADAQRIGELLRAVEAPAPAGLQRRIADRNAPRRWWQGAPAIALGVAGAASAACVALILALTSGATSAAPTVAAPRRLVATGTRIVFPRWSAPGWPRSGIRRDRVRGRAVTTQIYGSWRVGGDYGYAIVSGAPLTWGAGGTIRVVHGERYGLISTAGTHLVTWAQEGHTCILASRAAPLRALLALAKRQEAGAA